VGGERLRELRRADPRDHRSERSVDAFAFVVRDGSTAAATSAVWTRSANWTDDAWTLQENNIITVSSPAVAAAYLTDFEQLWAAGSIKATGVNDTGTATVRRASVGWTDRIVTEAGRQLYGKNRHHLD